MILVIDINSLDEIMLPFWIDNFHVSFMINSQPHGIEVTYDHASVMPLMTNHFCAGFIAVWIRGGSHQAADWDTGGLANG